MNAADLSQFNRLLRDIELRNQQLRRLDNLLLLDTEFLHFCDKFDAFERVLVQATADEELDRLSIDSGTHAVISLFEQQVPWLKELKTKCLHRISKSNSSLNHHPDKELENRFLKILESNLLHLQQTDALFRSEIQRAFRHLGDISLIAELQTALSNTDYLVKVVRKNQLNCIRLLQSIDLRHIFNISCSRLRFAVNSLLVVILIQFRELLEIMDGEESFREVHQKLQRDIRQSLNETQVNEDELIFLRQKLFPSPVSLTTQRTVAIDQRDGRQIDLKEQMRAIDILEGDKQEIEGRVAQLIMQRETIETQLEDRKQFLNECVHEIALLEKLIERIEREISDGIVEFQEQTKISEQNRLEVMQDTNMRPNHSQKLLEVYDAEMMERRKSHKSKISLLEVRRDELRRISSSLAQNMESFRDEISRKHAAKIAELELKKQQATLSEQELIETMIQQQQAEYDENLSTLDRVRSSSAHVTNDSKRHSVNENETREPMDHRNSLIPEQLELNENLQFHQSSTEIMQEDATGVYCIDKFGKKIYHRQYFTDPLGKYHIDDAGVRIYVSKFDSQANISQLGAFASHQTNGTSVPEANESKLLTADDALSDTESVRDRRERVASDLAYIEETLGVSLRKGLAAVARAKPEDPAGFLSDFLALLSKNTIEYERRQQLLERVQKADKRNEVGCANNQF